MGVFDQTQKIGDHTMAEWNQFSPSKAISEGADYTSGLAGTDWLSQLTGFTDPLENLLKGNKNILGL